MSQGANSAVMLHKFWANSYMRNELSTRPSFVASSTLSGLTSARQLTGPRLDQAKADASDPIHVAGISIDLW